MKKIMPYIAAVAFAAGCNGENLDDVLSKQEPVIKAIIQRESSGNSNAERYEPHLGDTSYGLMQVLTETAKVQKRKHPELPKLENIEESLKDPEINIAYGTSLFNDAVEMYGDIELAIAAYNSGLMRPAFAADQLNLSTFSKISEIPDINLIPDGVFGKQTAKAVLNFQEYWNKTYPDDKIVVDGKMGPQTRSKLYTALNKQGLKPETGVLPQIPHTVKYVKDVLSLKRKYE